MCLRYSGPSGNYPVYVCVADSNSEGRPRCQEVRALTVDAEVERLILMALTPDRIAFAVAALGEVEEEIRAMERQWSLKRERARYDAERARRQYDAVEPENRLVARSLERVWEERLRRADQIEQDYHTWRREQAVSIVDSDRQEILALGEDLPRLWHAATTRSADRKQIMRLVIKEVTLDQKRRRGYVRVRVKIIWQTGAVSEHWLQRCVQSYAQYADQDRLRQRIAELNGLQKMDGEIAAILGRYDSPFAEALADPDYQDQRHGSEPTTMARWKLLGTGCCRRHRHHAAGRLRLAPKRVADRSASRQGHALANRAVS
jgi:hypothetical protein